MTVINAELWKLPCGFCSVMMMFDFTRGEWKCRSCGNSIEADKTEQCRKCKRWGFKVDEFLSPNTGLCAECSNPCVVNTFCCKVCGVQKGETNHWFIVGCDDFEGTKALAMCEWSDAEATLLISDGKAFPVCGHRHALVLVERWLDRRTFEPYVNENNLVSA